MKLFIVVIFIITFDCYAKRLPVNESAKPSIEKLFTLYAELHSSFYHFRQDGIVSNASNLISFLEKQSNPFLNENFQLSRHLLIKINKRMDRKKLNEIFSSISMNFVSVVQKYKLDSKYNVFDCPMVQKKWIQNISKHTEVRNPYAPEMPNCGRKLSNYEVNNES